MWEVRRVAYASNQRRLVASWTPWGLTRSCKINLRKSDLTTSFFNREVPVTLKYTDREDRRATLIVEMAHGSARRDLCTLASAWLSLAY